MNYDSRAIEELDIRLKSLRRMHPWPVEKPEVPSRNHGWFDGRPEILRHWIPRDCRVILELGAWLGKSTRWFSDFSVESEVITIDHWNGSVEHHEQEPFRAMLPDLYDTFIVNCWEYQDQIIPIRSSTIEGMTEILSLGISPDFIYIDASHDRESVSKDLEFCFKHFEHAIITGDDWLYFEVAPGVMQALNSPLGKSKRLWTWNNVWGVFPKGSDLPIVQLK